MHEQALPSVQIRVTKSEVNYLTPTFPKFPTLTPTF